MDLLASSYYFRACTLVHDAIILFRYGIGLLRKLRSDSPRRFSDTEVLRRLHARSKVLFQAPFDPVNEDVKTPNAEVAAVSISNGGGHAAARRPSGQGQNRDGRSSESGLPFPAAFSSETDLSMPSMVRTTLKTVAKSLSVPQIMQFVVAHD